MEDLARQRLSLSQRDAADYHRLSPSIVCSPRRNGNMPLAPERSRRIHGATRLARTKPTALAVEASGTASDPLQSHHSQPMHLASTICTVMFRNGSRIVITPTMTERRQTARRGLRAAIVIPASSAGVDGTAVRSTSVPPAGAAKANAEPVRVRGPTPILLRGSRYGTYWGVSLGPVRARSAVPCRRPPRPPRRRRWGLAAVRCLPATALATSWRKIDVFGILVNGVRQSEARRVAGGVGTT